LLNNNPRDARFVADDEKVGTMMESNLRTLKSRRVRRACDMRAKHTGPGSPKYFRYLFTESPRLEALVMSLDGTPRIEALVISLDGTQQTGHDTDCNFCRNMAIRF
jgi:hypothetical protein